MSFVDWLEHINKSWYKKILHNPLEKVFSCFGVYGILGITLFFKNHKCHLAYMLDLTARTFIQQYTKKTINILQDKDAGHAHDKRKNKYKY